MTVTTGTYYTAADWPDVEAAPGVHRQVLSCGENIMIVKFTIQAGAAVPTHSHPHEQVGHVVSGRMTLQIGHEQHELGPGDGYAIPGGVMHGAVGITSSVAVDSFHPVREDYR